MPIDLRQFRKYLPISDAAREWGLWCTDAGATVINPGDAYPRQPGTHPESFAKGIANGLGRVLTEYQLIYITKGRGHFQYLKNNGEVLDLSVEAGSAIILYPGIWHSYAPDKSTGWNEYWVGFRGEIPKTLQQKQLLNSEQPVSPIGLHENFITDFKEIFTLIDEEPPAFQMIISGIILKMLGQVTSLNQGGGMAQGTERAIRIAKIYFEEHLEGDLVMEDLLERVGMSYSVFQRTFKEYTGLSPYSYFLQLKIHEACRLLLDRVPVKEIAFKLSFENPYYFSRLFKNKTGLSPTKWQQGALLSEEKPSSPIG
ncbi:MAG: helix-turn-helix domain-containing protein [Spirochaetales bacterium]|nr:helix-turn-helix domain-containing protein [Spirochaetales bacterium]